MSNGTHSIEDCLCTAETDLAIQVTGEDIDADTWVPKSQVHDDSEVYKLHDTGVLVVTEWFARQRGWL